MPDAKPVRALHIPAAVLAHLSLSLLECAILAEVIDLYKVQGHVFASDEHFAKRCHVKARTVRQSIAELIVKGFLTRTVDYTARHKRQLVPTLLWQNSPGVVAKSATTPGEFFAATQEVSVAEDVADFATSFATVPVESAGSSGEIRRDLWQNLPGVMADSANINTSLNTKTNNTLILTQKKECESPSKIDSLQLAEKITTPNPIAPSPSPTAPRPSFEDFWQAFGKKEDKHRCEQMWGTLTPIEQYAAIERVPAYVLATPEKRFRKNPLNWLNNKCWLDEELPPPPAGLLNGQTAGSSPPPARASSSPTKKKPCWS